MRLTFWAAALALLVPGQAASAQSARSAAATPHAIVEELLETDRAFAAASAKTDLASGISAMFAEDVAMPMPPGRFSRSKAEAMESLRSNPANAGARAEWTPVRGGVSADGRHGFTLGYMTISAEGAEQRHAKYVAYWMKKPQGWRVVSYKRGGRAEGEVKRRHFPPALPPRLIKAKADAAAIAGYKASLDRAERSFADEAQKIGLGAAFRKYGRADAMNMGRGAEFLVGADNIGADMGNEPISPVTWAPDQVLVAASGDLGITWGFIRPKGPVPEGQPTVIPYTTVWRRDNVAGPWRYVAE